MRDLPEESGATIVYVFAVFYGILLGLGLCAVLTWIGWWP
jgi:hypothetical protein